MGLASFNRARRMAAEAAEVEPAVVDGEAAEAAEVEPAVVDGDESAPKSKGKKSK